MRCASLIALCLIAAPAMAQDRSNDLMPLIDSMEGQIMEDKQKLMEQQQQFMEQKEEIEQLKRDVDRLKVQVETAYIYGR